MATAKSPNSPPSTGDDAVVVASSNSMHQGSDSTMNSHPKSHHLERVRTALGLKPEAPVDDEHHHITLHHHSLWWPKIRFVLREPFAEFFGVFIMILFGDGSVAQVLLSGGQKASPGGDGYGSYQSINWG